MTAFDDRIRDGLTADDEAFLKDLEDGRGLFRQLGGTLKGPLGGWSALAWGFAVVASVIGVFAVWRMFQADTTRGLILWAAAAWAAWTIQINVKQWIYDRMNTLSILRELKKLELRVTRAEEARR